MIEMESLLPALYSLFTETNPQKYKEIDKLLAQIGNGINNH